MTVTSVAIATTTFLFSMRDFTVDSVVDTGDFSLVLEILDMCRHPRVRSHKSPGMDCCTITLEGQKPYFVM